MKDAVDDDAERLAADLGDDHKTFVVGAWSEPQQLLELDQRQQLVAQPQHRRVLDALDVMLAAVGGPHQFEDGKLRYGKALGAGFDDERGDDRQRQRNFDRERRAGTGRRFQIDGAADLLDVGAHHIHADAAAGYAGDRRGGRKTRREDQIADLGVRLAGHLGLVDKTLLDRLGADARQIEPAAVVGDLNDDVAALMAGRQADGAFAWFAGGEALGRRLNAVIGAIAHHVGERIFDQLEHLAIELGFGAVRIELDVLAELGRKIADDPRQLLPRIADRLHARLHHAFLQLGGDVRQPLQRHLEIGILVAADDFEQLVAGQHQLRNRIHQMVEGLHLDADGLA